MSTLTLEEHCSLYWELRGIYYNKFPEEIRQVFYTTWVNIAWFTPPWYEKLRIKHGGYPRGNSNG